MLIGMVGLLGAAGVVAYFDRGPLGHLHRGVSPSEWTVCGPVGEGRLLTLGANVLWHESPRSVELLEVSLAGADGVSLIEAVVLPIPSDGVSTGIGAVSGYPMDTSDEHLRGVRWEDSVPAVGALLVANDPVTRQLVAGIALEEGRAFGRSEGILVRYRAGWRSYTVDLPFAFILTESATCFDEDD